MDKLQLDTEPREATIRFTVDLPESMHRKLSILSAKTGAKKAHIVRKLLEQVLIDVDD
jgi:predicted DNA-binding protein